MAENIDLENDNQYAPGIQDVESQTKSFGEVLRIAMDQWTRANVHVSVPVKVTKVYNNSFVDAQVQIQELFIVQGAVTVPPLQNIPIEHPRGNDWWIKLPVAVGDFGRVIICDRSIENWMQNGMGPLDPQDTRQHDWSDAVFIPGLYPQNNVLPGSPDDMILHNGEAEIYLQKTGTFKITNGVVELFDLLDTLLESLVSATVVTAIGPQPFTPTSIAEFTEVLTEMQTLTGE